MPRYVYRGERKTAEKDLTPAKVSQKINNDTKQAMIKHYVQEFNYLCMITINEYFGATYDPSNRTDVASMRSIAFTALRRRHADAYEHVRLQIKQRVYAELNYTPPGRGNRESLYETFIQRLVDMDVPKNFNGVDLS